MSKYKRLTKGLNNVGKLIPVGDDPYKYVTDTTRDWYLSVYEYTEDHKKQAEENIEKDGKKDAEKATSRTTRRVARRKPSRSSK